MTGRNGGHRLDDVGDAPGDRLERRTRDVRGADAGCSPAITPRASGRHQGAPSPASAGSTITPALSGTLAAAAASARRVGRQAEPAREPVEQRACREHAAVERVETSPGAAGARRRSGPRDRRQQAAREDRLAVRPSTNTPVPYVAFSSPGRTAPEPASAACWSTSWAASGIATGQRSWRARRARRSSARCGGSHSRRMPNAASSSSSQSRPPTASSWVRDAVERSVAKRPPSRSARNASTVPRRSVPASRARAARRRRWRAARRACRPRSRGRAAGPSAAPTCRVDAGEQRFLALVLPDDHGRQRAAAARVPGEHRLALVVEPRRQHLAAARLLEHLGDRVDDRLEDQLRILLDPAGRGWVTGTARRASATARRSLIEQRRLDRGRALVDAQQQRRRSRRLRPAAPERRRAAARRALPPRLRPDAGRRRRRRCRRGSAASARRDRAVRGEHARDVLADRERRRQAGGADRRDMDQSRQRARALDHVVGVAPGRAQPGVGADRLDAARARGTCAWPARGSARAASASTDQSRLSSRSRAVGPAIDRRGVERREHEHALAERRGHRQQDLARAAHRGGANTRNSPLRGIDARAESSPARSRDASAMQSGAVDGRVDVQRARPRRARRETAAGACAQAR